MTIIEVAVAFAIFAALLAPVAQLVNESLRSSGNSRARVVAANVATQALEQVRATGYASVTPNTTSSSTVKVAGVPYAVTQSSRFLPESGSSGGCDAPSSGNVSLQPELLVQVSVTWPSLPTNELPVSQSTALIPPAGTYSGTGNLDVQVLAANSSPQEGVPVTFVGPSPQTSSQVITTDAQGCAFAAYLQPGSYAISLDEPGFVDPEGNQVPSATDSVSLGQTTFYQFFYDRAATAAVSFSGSAPVVAGVPVSVQNSALGSPGIRSFAGGTTTLTNLFPFPSGYKVFAGHCPEADPEAVSQQGQALYPGAPLPPSVTPAPGSSASVTVPTYPLELVVTDSAGAPVGSVVASATELQGQAATPCTGLLDYSLYATQTSNGLSATGMPLGEFEVSVPGANPFDVWVKPGEVLDESTGVAYPTGTAIPVSIP